MIRLAAIWIILLLPGCRISDDKVLPNVLIILTDDQGYGDVGYQGNPLLETPVLDSLATRSVVFDRFYVSPVCAPTRASLLTGKYHLSTGVSWVTHRKEVMRQNEITIAEYLKEKGYSTGLFGKWHNGSQYPHDPVGQGFDTFIGFKEGHFNNYFNPMLVDGFDTKQFEGYLPDIITSQATEFIERSREPFLAMVAYNTPHSPFQVPDEYFDKYVNTGLDDRLACIYGMVENIDFNVGRLIDQLEASGQLENTLVLFVGDNGPNGVRYNAGLKGIKSHVDEGGVRVPALLSYPQKGWNTGQHIDQLAAHIDILPTVAGLLGDDLGASLDGMDLAQLIDGQPTTRTFFTHQVVRSFDRYPGAVREGDYLLTIKDGSNELFNLTQDKGQQIDLADSLSEYAADLRTKYEQWIDESIEKLGSTELIETGHEGINRVTFPASEVSKKMNVDFKGTEGWANDYLINFSNTSQIAWQLKTINTVVYDAWVELNSSAGTELTLFVDSVYYPIIIEERMVKEPVESPDRNKRGEVYEYTWPQLSLGRIALAPGQHTIGLTTGNPQNLEIKSLQLLASDE